MKTDDCLQVTPCSPLPLPHRHVSPRYTASRVPLAPYGATGYVKWKSEGDSCTRPARMPLPTGGSDEPVDVPGFCAFADQDAHQPEIDRAEGRRTRSGQEDRRIGVAQRETVSRHV